jgi:hypothetical protein
MRSLLLHGPPEELPEGLSLHLSWSLGAELEHFMSKRWSHLHWLGVFGI